MRAYDFSRLSS